MRHLLICWEWKGRLSKTDTLLKSSTVDELGGTAGPAHHCNWSQMLTKSGGSSHSATMGSQCAESSCAAWPAGQSEKRGGQIARRGLQTARLLQPPGNCLQAEAAAGRGEMSAEHGDYLGRSARTTLSQLTAVVNCGNVYGFRLMRRRCRDVLTYSSLWRVFKGL